MQPAHRSVTSEVSVTNNKCGIIVVDPQGQGHIVCGRGRGSVELSQWTFPVFGVFACLRAFGACARDPPWVSSVFQSRVSGPFGGGFIGGLKSLKPHHQCSAQQEHDEGTASSNGWLCAPARLSNTLIFFSGLLGPGGCASMHTPKGFKAPKIDGITKTHHADIHTHSCLWPLFS